MIPPCNPRERGRHKHDLGAVLSQATIQFPEPQVVANRQPYASQRAVCGYDAITRQPVAGAVGGDAGRGLAGVRLVDPRPSHH